MIDVECRVDTTFGLAARHPIQKRAELHSKSANAAGKEHLLMLLEKD
jgi:hypothetical protein